MKNTAALIAAFALVCGAAAAQTPTGTNAGGGQTQDSEIQQDKTAVQNTKADIAKDVKDERGDREKLNDLNKAHADAIQDLNAKEKAAVDAVRDDKSLTAAQKKARIDAIRKDYNAQRKTINNKYKADSKVLRTDMRKDRRDIHQDHRQLHNERADLHHDIHSGGGKH